MKLPAKTLVTLLLICATLQFGGQHLQAAEKPFIGRWALTLPDGRAGWLGVEPSATGLSAQMLLGSGSVIPANEVVMSDHELQIVLTQEDKHTKSIRHISAKCHGDELTLSLVSIESSGARQEPQVFTGHRIAALPPRPDLSKVVFGPVIELITNDLTTVWQKVNPNAPSGWSVNNGELSNRVPQGKHPRLGNLRTKECFGDCRITAEFRTLHGSNSGIYLRGLYEIQVADTYGKLLDSHNMGAVYSRITPTLAAEKPVGEWQTLEAILVDRHITVILNGQKIIDNQPVLGCTGGALNSDESLPGPLMLQGDHSDIDFRHLRLFPVRS